MEYPIALITAYKCRQISKEQFEKQFSALQGFDNSIKSYGNKSGIYAEYRGRKAHIRYNVLEWKEKDGKLKTAYSYKEYLIRVDSEETRAAKCKNSYLMNY